MADSLFDNRYRYDYIYPRGRSGETLRAVDTEQRDRPVVIKRPAPNDAPPIRAGQEVSILNERKALHRLAGHTVLVELLGSGQFFVGGVTHQYIVMERADGTIIADLVAELASQGERLPQLEMLVIMDNLLDLLQIAHARDIVYNDVDAKHLFWNRDGYHLKVIDWGNAVFLEGDEVTPQGISRQNDIQQAGEVLYFILSGGRRAEIPRDVGEDFLVSFGQDQDRVPQRLQEIISKALHPNLRLRYRTIADLRKDLNSFATPLEQERDSIINSVTERLRFNLSKNDLRGLLNTLDPALVIDPGFPKARHVRDDIVNRLRDLDVSADLDAVRIYMEGGNWNRAANLLNELGEKAGTKTAGTVNLLLDFTTLLLDANPDPTPLAIQDAIILTFEGQAPAAARVLLTDEPEDDEDLRLQWLIAERISSRIPEVLLLRPNLYRLDMALTSLNNEEQRNDGGSLKKSRALLAEINQMLDDLPGTDKVDFSALRDGYRAVVDKLTALNKLLATVSVQLHLSNRRLPLSSLDRALNAAMALADNMHVIGKQATSSPRDATVALDGSRAIDPVNPLWGEISRVLNRLYELLQSYQTYVPAADGSDLEAWLMGAHSDLSPFLERLFDEMLQGMVEGLHDARRLWSQYAIRALQGNRIEAVRCLAEASEAVGTISPTLAGWFNQLRSVVEGASHVERHAIFGGLGRALADGWEAFDRGRLADAERLGQQAYDISRSDLEQQTANRLLKLTRLTREWVERSGVNDLGRSNAALAAIDKLFTGDEIEVREGFARQMPSKETYLKAMGKGMIEIYERTSSAAIRLLFMYDILLGTLEAHDGNLEDAQFWRDVAVRVFDIERSQPHPATRTLDEFIDRRRVILDAERQLNQINGRHAIGMLESTRRQLEDNSETRILAGGIHSLRELEAGLRDWSDGEFRVAGLKIENALKAVNDVEQAASITLTEYRAWLMELNAAAAQLHTTAREMRQMIERREQAPSPIVRDAHRKLAETTHQMLGDEFAATLDTWRDLYEQFLAAYTDSSIRRSGRLARFNELFRAMFIDRHPAYPLYRHWYDITENSPEFPAPPTDDPTPRMAEADIQEEAYSTRKNVFESDSSDAYEDHDTRQTLRNRGGRFSRRTVIGVMLLGLVGIIAAVVVLGGGNGNSGTTLLITETAEENGTSEALASTAEVTEPAQSDADATNSTIGLTDFSTPTLITPTTRPATDTPSPTDTEAPTEVVATSTNAPPTATRTASNTPTSTITLTPTATFTPTLPPQGLQGWQDFLALATRMDPMPWEREDFEVDATGSWRMGTGVVSEEDDIQITFPADVLNTYYGNGAPSRIRRTEATVALTTYLPDLLDENQVYFGILFQNASEDTQEAGLFVEVVGTNVVNLWQRINGENTFIRQVSVNVITPTIRLERDAVSGGITAFFNNVQVGNPMPFATPEADILPVLFVQNGGVILNITDWRVNLR
ncbi:MAG: hypothetical protein RLP44_05065 [Aggregatilineales bacterium]